MIKLNKSELRDKIYACWLGKNIGGTLGTQYEGLREINDCKGFSTKAGAPLPNDDLDLQLVWLLAFKNEGAKALNSKVLGEYWLEYITPYWNEYGISKANMRHGLVPPLSGEYKNYWKHSNGAWIRTEVWACLYPGRVESAIRYAYEDSCVDHGSGEGTYAAIFTAAVESAAFIVDDINKLLEIGLSKIPSDSRMFKYITKAVECYKSGMSWQDARNTLAEMSLADPELGWFQAPANIGYTVIGLLYGGGDFKKTLLIACNCGDDTDCTCATAGALLGIMHGTAIIPNDWKDHIGDDIITKCINTGAADVADNSMEIPLTCTQLTNEIVNLHNITIYDDAADNTSDDTDTEKFMGNDFALSLENRSGYYAEYESLLAKCLIEYSDKPEITPNGEISFKLSLKNKFVSQKSYNIEWMLPDGWSVSGNKSISCMNPTQSEQAEYTVTAGENVNSKNMLVISISCDGHFDMLLIPIILFG